MYKKFALLVISFILALSLIAACTTASPGGTGSPQPAVSPTPQDTPTPQNTPTPTPELTPTPPSTDPLPDDGLTVLDGIIDGARARFEMFPYCYSEEIINKENAPTYLGLTSAEITEYLSGAWLSNAIIDTSAYEVAMVTVKNAESAPVVADLMTKFNAHRWICVAPQICETVTIGSQIFLIASSIETADAIKAELSSTTGIPIDQLDVNRFFTLGSESEGSGDNGGGIDFGSLIPG